MARERRLVLDTNILMRAVLGRRFTNRRGQPARGDRDARNALLCPDRVGPKCRWQGSSRESGGVDS